MLAGWFRVLYPELVHASVSSSAPVVAKLDMNEYYDVGSRAYGLSSAGGSSECYSILKDGHAEIGNLTQTSAGRQQLVGLFPKAALHGADWLATSSGRLSFSGVGVISFPAQSNDPTCTYRNCNIERICATVEAGSATKTPLERLSTLAGGPGDAVVEIDAVVEVDAIAKVDAVTEAPRAEVSVASPHLISDYWGYQTCTEFGFYQTCEVGTDCFFTQGLLVLPELDSFCEAYWGITPSMIQESIDETNQFYGAARPDLAHNATRIFYVNGNVDPWSGLSILSPPAPTLPTLMVDGASHHAWTHPSAPSDQKSVVDARKAIHEQVAKWLAEP